MNVVCFQSDFWIRVRRKKGREEGKRRKWMEYRDKEW
jgi:hypothetical protein